mmetsp:Transcript_4688/g.11434  ORF Transcript_4688/g.11434 Transcript_4688/m.11434 type:complete len:208 (+) Transcript_4688:26-649(+)
MVWYFVGPPDKIVFRNTEGRAEYVFRIRPNIPRLWPVPDAPKEVTRGISVTAESRQDPNFRRAVRKAGVERKNRMGECEDMLWSLSVLRFPSGVWWEGGNQTCCAHILLFYSPSRLQPFSLPAGQSRSPEPRASERTRNFSTPPQKLRPSPSSEAGIRRSCPVKLCEFAPRSLVYPTLPECEPGMRWPVMERPVAKCGIRGLRWVKT